MEERKRSPEQPEEVIELLDIVGQSAGEKTGAVSEQENPAPLAAGEEAASAEPAGEELLELEADAQASVPEEEDLPDREQPQRKVVREGDIAGQGREGVV